MFQPETWTLAEPLAKADYTPDSKPPFVCTLLPPSTQTFNQQTGWASGGNEVHSQYAIDIQLSFLFPNNLLYHQIPIDKIIEAMGWLCTLLTKHDNLLTLNKSELANLTNWQYGLINPCHYDSHPDRTSLTSVEASWEMSKVQATKIKDWLVLVSLQIRVSESCPIAEYVPTPSGIVTPYPNQLGGIQTSPTPPFVLINNFIYGQYVPVQPGTPNADGQEYPRQYSTADTPSTGHNASFDVVVRQGIKGRTPPPQPLPPLTQLPFT
jgi:hypothetical protein